MKLWPGPKLRNDWTISVEAQNLPRLHARLHGSQEPVRVTLAKFFLEWPPWLPNRLRKLSENRLPWYPVVSSGIQWYPVVSSGIIQWYTPKWPWVAAAVTLFRRWYWPFEIVLRDDRLSLTPASLPGSCLRWATQSKGETFLVFQGRPGFNLLFEAMDASDG